MSRHGPLNLHGFLKRTREAVAAADRHRLERVAVLNTEKLQIQATAGRWRRFFVVATVADLVELAVIGWLLVRLFA